MGGKKWRRAVRLFVAAGLLGGMARPAAAQSGAAAGRPPSAPAATANPSVGILWAESDDSGPPGLDLAAPAQPPAPAPAPAVAAPAARLDVLAVPTVPVRWSAPAPAPLPQPPAHAVPVNPAPPPAAPTPTPAARPVVTATQPPAAHGQLPPAPPPIYPSHKWPPAHSVRPGPGSVRVASADDLRAPPPPPGAAPPVPQMPTITTGRILLEDPAPAPPPRPAPALAPRPAARPAPTPAPPPAAPPSGPPLSTAGPLKRRIESACGNRVHDVEIISRGDWGQLVKVRVDNAANQQEVMARLMTIYELSSPRVRVEVEVAK
jgi:Meckel syndrome type 1 protein